MRFLRPAVRVLGAGVLAGLLALALDQLLAVLTLGYPVPVAPRYVAAYAVLGAVAALAAGAVALISRRALDGWAVFAVAVAGVYVPAIFERVHHAAGHSAGPFLAIVAAVLAAGGYGLWILLLGRVADSWHGGDGPRSSAAGGAFRGAGARVMAPLLGAAAASVGLAVNRNLVDYPLEPAALAADVAVLGASLALAYLGRIRGARRALGAAAALALGALALAAAGRWQTSSTSPGATGRAPNLVLVIIDTLRQDTFQRVVRQTEEGRAFREAMAGSAWFSRAIAAAPYTAPSVGSIMTGLYPQEHGFEYAAVKDKSRPLVPLTESVPTLAETLRRAGYRTEAIGANPLLHPVSGIARGFDHYEILSGPTVKLPPLTALGKLDLVREDKHQDARSVRRRLRQRLGEMTASGRPVFLWLQLMDPHDPLKNHRGLAPDPEAAGLDELRRLYRDEVRFALRELTSMLELMRARGLWRNTAWVVVSDHGEMFPADGRRTGLKTMGTREPMLYGHGHAMYGELVRVPLMIRPPGGLPETRRLKNLTSHVDLHDTILDLLGIDAPRTGRDRVSLAPWLRRPSPEPGLRGRSYALIGANHGPQQRALRTRGFKLIEHLERRRPEELYRIAADPGERRNLAGLEKDRLARIQERLESYWAQLDEAPATAPAELDVEALERLKALGYVP